MATPAIWGPAAWKLIHGIGALADAGHVSPTATRRFFKTLGTVLPCVHCRTSYGGYWREHAEELKNPSVSVVAWTHALHDFVNAKLAGQGEACRRLPLSVLRRRLAIWTPYFSDMDVRILIAVCLENTASKGSPPTVAEVKAFASAVAVAIGPAAPATADWLRDWSAARGTTTAAARRQLFTLLGCDPVTASSIIRTNCMSQQP